jgi:hypothetical protein
LAKRTGLEPATSGVTGRFGVSKHDPRAQRPDFP